MLQWIRRFRREDRAQDLIEYTLLMGFVVLVALGLFAGSGTSVQGIWSSAGSTVDQAASVTGTAATTTPGNDGHHDHHGDH